MKKAKERWEAFRGKYDAEHDAPINGVKLRHEHTLKEIDQLYEVIAVLESRILEIENANQ